MKFVRMQYVKFQALAFSTVSRKKWPLRSKLVWWYLLIFVWLHQGIFHKNWQNVFKG